MARMKGSQESPSTGAPERRRRPLLEIQYHPANIRREVRYFFLDRRQVTWWALGLVAYTALLIFGLVLGPAVVRNYLAARQYQVEIDKRELLGQRLGALLARLDEIEGETDTARVEMSKIYLAYGFDYNESKGKGGYPYEADEEISEAIGEEIRGEILTGRELQAKISEQMAVLGTFLEEVQSFEEAHRDQVHSTPSISPVKSNGFVLTSPFGQRQSPFTKSTDFHAGIDLAAPVGTPVYAPADGRVAFAGRYSLKRSVAWWRYGNLVALTHGDRFVTLFGHLEDVEVRPGQEVKQGELIGTVGNTGWSTNPHLHYEVRRKEADGDFRPVDPRIYILDHRWRNEELLLVRARSAPDASDYEPLPRLLSR